MSNQPASLIQSLKDVFTDYIANIYEFRGEITFTVVSESIFDICSRLKNDYGFLYIADLTAVDYLEVKHPRYEVVYYLHRFGENYEDNTRVRLKAELPNTDPKIDSVTPIWKSANWLEREVYDMFGIEFTGHPDLRRILMPEDYEEFPLRKDFDVRNREPSKRSFENDLLKGNN